MGLVYMIVGFLYGSRVLSLKFSSYLIEIANTVQFPASDAVHLPKRYAGFQVMT